MLLYIALIAWGGILAEIILSIRSRQITRDPEKTHTLPFKSRVLGTDKIEKNAPTVTGVARYRLLVYAGYIFFAVGGETMAGFIAVITNSTAQNELSFLTFYHYLGRFIVASAGGLIGAMFGFSQLQAAD